MANPPHRLRLIGLRRSGNVVGVNCIRLRILHDAIRWYLDLNFANLRDQRS